MLKNINNQQNFHSYFHKISQITLIYSYSKGKIINVILLIFSSEKRKKSAGKFYFSGSELALLFLLYSTVFQTLP